MQKAACVKTNRIKHEELLLNLHLVEVKAFSKSRVISGKFRTLNRKFRTYTENSDRGFISYFRENFQVFFGKVLDFETGVLYRKIFDRRNSGFLEFRESQKSENFRLMHCLSWSVWCIATLLVDFFSLLI